LSLDLEEESSNEEELNFYSELIITTINTKILDAVYEAIYPETTVVISSRGRTSIEIQDTNKLILKFFATDFISLRAMIGSYLRWVDAAISSILTK